MTTSLETQLSQSPIVPVVTPYTAEGTVELAKALVSGGVNSIEITLRTPVAMESLVAVKEANIEGLNVGVGTLTSAEDIHRVADLNLDFAISPGLTANILSAAKETGLPLVPGVNGPSDILLGKEYGLEFFKLFPAGAIGGMNLLKALYGPFPDIKFCPTGGVNAANMLDYLALPNVICVGGSWMVPSDAVKSGDWETIVNLCSAATDLVSQQAA